MGKPIIFSKAMVKIFNVGWQNWYINHKWYKLKGVNNDSRGSLDVVPAGTFTTGKILRDEIAKGVEDAGLSSEVRGTNIDTHSFIPTFSSLAHLNPYQNWSNPLNTNLACYSNKQTPFDSYFGNATNTPHIFLNKEMVDWLLKELAGNPQAPYFPIQAGLLTGDDVVCNGINKNYTITDVCKVPSQATFTVQGNLIIVGSNTGYSVTVQGTSNDASVGTIIATFQNGQKITKLVNVGSPIIDYTSSSSFINGVYGWYCAGFANNASPMVITAPTATSYKWYIDLDQDFTPNCSSFSTPSLAKITNNNSIVTTTTPAIYQSSSNTCNINWGNCTGQYLLRCYAVNDCGETPYLMKYVTVGRAADNPCTQDTGMSRYAVFPNPIKDGTITVNFTPSQLPCDPPTEYKTIVNNTVKEVKIFDMQGNQMFQNKYEEEEETFSIKGLNLKTGYYIINITFPNGIIEKKVIMVE